MAKTLYLIRGVSGAGKTTFAKELVLAKIASRFLEADQYFHKYNFETGEWTYNFDASKLHEAHKLCQEITEQELIDGNSVVVSNTSTTANEVQVYQDIATRTNARFVSLIVENRNNTSSVHDVPEGVLQRQRSRFDIKL